MRKIIFIAIFIISSVLITRAVFAYNNQTTHPALTSEAVDFYNLNFDKKITDEEKEWLISGSILEDAEPRYINHFYDPVYKVGWSGEHAVFSQEFMQEFSDIFLANARPVSAVNWAQNQELQAKYKRYQGNRTWEKALYEYVKNKNAKEAFTSLGYVIHLIEDMAVAEHTRNDTHTPADESPYESYASQFNRDNFHIVGDLKNQNQKPVSLNSLNDYFNYLASYSNNYFFSKDTINEKKYLNPKIIENDEKFGYGVDKNNIKFPLARADVYMKEGVPKIIYFLDTKEELILHAYWTRLSKEAVLASAGVIDLFFKEVARAGKDPSLLKSPPEETSAVISIYGELTRLPQIATEITNKIKNTITGITNRVANNAVNSWNKLTGTGGGQSSAIIQFLPALTNQVPQSSNDTAVATGNPQNIAVVENPAPPSPAAPPPPPAPIEASGPPAPSIQPGFTVLPPSRTFTPSLPYPGFGGGSNPSPAPIAEPQQPFSQGANSNKNTENNSSASSTPPAPSDVEGPDISFSILECVNSFSSNGCLVATTTLHLLWQSAADDLDYFELTQNDAVSTTTSTSTTVSLADNSANNFSVRAKDKTGNWSALQTLTAEIYSMPVVINEVAWAGTGNTKKLEKDEWIELYNRTNYDIDLLGWRLKNEAGDLNIIFGENPAHAVNRVIPAKGYYLIERTDDNAVSDVPADWKGPFGNGFNNGGEILILSYASTTIDQTVLCGIGPTKWCPGYDYKYNTMERIDPDVAGTDPSNWGANNVLIRNGKNADGQPVNGTPKARNSVNYIIAKGQPYVSSDITLKKANTYLVDNIPQTFQGNAVLTIEPGVVIKFRGNARMNFNENAKIVAQGAASEPIVFTSFLDDGYGGDLNGDASSTSPHPADWYGVELETTNNDSVFDYAIFRYGGKWYNGVGNHKANLSIKNTSATITNSVFEFSEECGLRLTDSDSTVSNNIFRNNNNPGNLAATGLAIEAGSPIIRFNNFLGNKTGIGIANPDFAVIDSNNFVSNSGTAISSFGHLADFRNNSGSSNVSDGIFISGDITRQDERAILEANSLVYSFDGDVNVVASSTLVVKPGVVVKASGGFWGGKLNVYGNFLAQGAEPSDIIFTSLYVNPQPGNWQGIRIYAGGSSDIKGAAFSYADKAISYYGSPIKLGNVLFENNNLAVWADEDTLSQSISALLVEFLNNLATTSPPGLW